MAKKNGHGLRKAYSTQKYNAQRRGIAFNLNFDEWLLIWTQSGKLPQRGKGSDKYCMARFHDKGAYEIGNVQIITHNENSIQIVRTRESNIKRSNALHGRVFTQAHRKKISRANKGRSFSADTRLAMSRSARDRWDKMSKLEKKVVMDRLQQSSHTDKLNKQHSKFLRSYWAKKTEQERQNQGALLIKARWKS